MNFYTTTKLVLAILLLSTSVIAQAASKDSKPPFKAVAFDLFVIFDPGSVVPYVEKEFPGKGIEFTRAWQSKQFDYAFIHSITNRYEDFFQITGNALEHTAQTMNLALSEDARARLLNTYLTLRPWADAVAALRKLRASGLRIIVLSNFSRKMLRANTGNAGIADLFDELLSTGENRTFKPDPQAYKLALKRLRLRKEEIAFAAFGGWDVYGAKSFGFPTFWVNRFNLPAERLGLSADGTSGDLEGFLNFVLQNGTGK